MATYLIVYTKTDDEMEVSFANKIVKIPQLTEKYIKQFEKRTSRASTDDTNGFEAKVINCIKLDEEV